MSEGARCRPATGAAHLRALRFLAWASLGLYALVAVLSWQFNYGAPGRQRPLVAVLLLFAVLFAVYLIAIRISSHVPQDKHLMRLVVGASIGFITPPYGLNLYVASGVTGVPYFRLLRYTVPYLFALLAVWIIVALVPALSTVLIPSSG